MPHHPVGHHKAAAPHKKPRKLSPGSDVACCTAEALGTLLGWTADNVLALYWRAAHDPCSGASILATLEASREFFPRRGFGKYRLELRSRPLEIGEHLLDFSPGLEPHGLILGVTLPEPHAIAVTPDGTWWSWGEPFSPHDWPELLIDEAWAVTL